MSDKSVPTNIAHIDGNGNIQPLEDHLLSVAELSESFGDAIGIGKMAYITGLVHDLGKASPEFSRYITGESSEYGRGDIIHSTSGAQLLRRLRSKMLSNPLKQYATEMAEIAIMSHHTGMIDCLTPDGSNNIERRFAGSDSLDTNTECIDGRILQEVESRLDDAATEFSSVIDAIRETEIDSEEKLLRMGLLNRLLLSCLIDADRIDTHAFCEHITYPDQRADWVELSRRLEDHVASFGQDDRISAIRKKVSNLCFDASSRPRGAYSLTVPTGGGKTISAFRFAINHLILNNMERIIVVVPYLSIIDQNARVMRGVLERSGEEPVITECHSNIDVGEGTDVYWDAATDSWDGPIIFTTIVQFLETLYSSGTRKVRRMHNLANAVIIFDEIQCLPIKTTYLFNAAVNFLTQQCGTTVVLSTATQPLLSRTEKLPLAMSINSEIVPDKEQLFEDMRRVDVKYLDRGKKAENPAQVSDLALKQLQQNDSVLIIVNTKRMARSIYLDLKAKIDADTSLYHLSTNMCPCHRAEKMSEIRSKLSRDKLVCVSTQLIEAGIDIDFDCVIRCLAGLDSIAQAAGRCNRHGRKDRAEVFVVKTDDELGPLTDIREGRKCSELILDGEVDDPVAPDYMSRFYRMYFFQRSKDMAYPVEYDNLVNMLSSNTNAVSAFKSQNHRNPELYSRQSYKTANSLFKVIEEMQSIIVPYDERSRNLISELSSGNDQTRDLKSIMRALQQYSINTYRLDEAIRHNIVYEIAKGSSIFCLRDGFYDDDLGLVERPQMNSLIF